MFFFSGIVKMFDDMSVVQHAKLQTRTFRVSAEEIVLLINLLIGILEIFGLKVV